jgi:hypothetical protein
MLKIWYSLSVLYVVPVSKLLKYFFTGRHIQRCRNFFWHRLVSSRNVCMWFAKLIKMQYLSKYLYVTRLSDSCHRPPKSLCFTSFQYHFSWITESELLAPCVLSHLGFLDHKSGWPCAFETATVIRHSFSASIILKKRGLISDSNFLK